MPLNPFFFRACLRTCPRKHALLRQQPLNPFFFRACLRTRARAKSLYKPSLLLIPFSSGHVFEQQRHGRHENPELPLNPFFFRACLRTMEPLAQELRKLLLIPFSSGHVFERTWRRLRQSDGLLIPFSSGHVFELAIGLAFDTEDVPLNPFFFRACLRTPRLRTSLTAAFCS